jgi:hypothetical protein
MPLKPDCKKGINAIEFNSCTKGKRGRTKEIVTTNLKHEFYE